jgi:hypothetical protein
MCDSNIAYAGSTIFLLHFGTDDVVFFQYGQMYNKTTFL